MEKIDMERASEELEYLDALIEKYQSKLQTITVNDIFKQELKRLINHINVQYFEHCPRIYKAKN